MAGDQLIERYLADLRRRLAWRADVDDVIAEAADHLLSAVERLVADGESTERAQQAVLGRFGDPTTVATAFAATSTGGLAMPTRFTRLAGVAAMIAAALWAVSAAMWLIDEFLEPSGRAEPVVQLVAFASLLGASALMVVVVVGLHRRHGGLGALGRIGLSLIGLSAVATLLFWFVMGWGVLLALGLLLVAIAVNARGLAPTLPTAAFGGAWLVAATTWSVLRYLEVGTRDEWGDFPAVSPLAIAVGVVILVPGLIGLGRWLSSETPADLVHGEPMATA